MEFGHAPHLPCLSTSRLTLFSWRARLFARNVPFVWQVGSLPYLTVNYQREGIA